MEHDMFPGLLSAIRAEVVRSFIDSMEPAVQWALIGTAPGIGCVCSVAPDGWFTPKPSLILCLVAVLMALALIPSGVSLCLMRLPLLPAYRRLRCL